MSTPFSVRLSPALDAAITAEARRTKRSKGSVLEALAEEALRMRRFPGIGFKGEDWDRRAWVMGSAFDVWEVIQAIDELGGADQAAAEGTLAPAQLALAQAYYRTYPQEVDDRIAENRRSLDDLARAYPMFEFDPDPATRRP